ncbi:MAG: hypothetical protein KJZ69_09495 [Phycisphaerales bacterium]|nr:hypothetical protein [Phycisphaerales bacterium]
MDDCNALGNAERRLAAIRKAQGVTENERAPSEHRSNGRVSEAPPSEHEPEMFTKDTMELQDNQDHEDHQGTLAKNSRCRDSVETTDARLAGAEESRGDASESAEPEQPNTPQRAAYLRMKAELDRGEAPTLTVHDAVLAAYGFMQESEPGRPAWQSGTFDFLRWIKASPHFEHMDAKQALAAVETVLAGWGKELRNRGSLKVGSKRDQIERAWTSLFDSDTDQAREEFIDGWDRVRLVPGRSLIDHAYRKAKSHPINFQDGSLKCDTEGYRGFLNLAGWLQVAVGANVIALPIEKIATMLNVTHMSISRYRRWAVEDNFLREIEPAVFKRKATTYIFDVRRVPMLSDAAHGDVHAWIAERFSQEQA